MRLNESVSIITNKLVLVPYQASHVKTYSEWMSDDALRAATASERLSLPEEHAMQKSWREDTDKLTFIVSHLSARVKELSHEGGEDSNPANFTVVEGIDDISDLLVGDVNLFLSDEDDEEEEEEEAKSKEVSQKPRGIIGELELMIARARDQGRGLGKVTVITFILYVLRHKDDILDQLPDRDGFTKEKKTLKYLCVKIGQENETSLGLFQKLGFIKHKEEPSYFGEFELRLRIQEQEAVEKNLRAILKDSGVNWMEEVKYQIAESNEANS